MAGAGFGSYAAIDNQRIDLMAVVFWAIFVLQILVSVNLSPAAQTFDPESLIRFPLSFPRYLTIRLFLGLLAPSTIAGTCSLLHRRHSARPSPSHPSPPSSSPPPSPSR